MGLDWLPRAAVPPPPAILGERRYPLLSVPPPQTIPGQLKTGLGRLAAAKHHDRNNRDDRPKDQEQDDQGDGEKERMHHTARILIRQW